MEVKYSKQSLSETHRSSLQYELLRVLTLFFALNITYEFYKPSLLKHRTSAFLNSAEAVEAINQPNLDGQLNIR
jgi:hypothetical protein